MDLTKLENQIKVQFKDRNLLQSALTHRSYLNENRKWPVPHNERLEFLGDAVLELITTEYLYRIRKGN
jgi:ribonuclease-3